MIAMIQRAIARAAAVAALLLGAALAMVLAVFTLFSGLLIGVVATIAAWFGARARHDRSQGQSGGGGPFGRRPDRRPEGTVIDVDMREIEPGNVDRAESGPDADSAARPGDADSPERPQRRG